MSAPPEWDDNVADLMALVAVAREDSLTLSGREALRVLGESMDAVGVVSAAAKLLAELAEDAGFCQAHFREYAFRAVTR